VQSRKSRKIKVSIGFKIVIDLTPPIDTPEFFSAAGLTYFNNKNAALAFGFLDSAHFQVFGELSEIRIFLSKARILKKNYFSKAY